MTYADEAYDEKTKGMMTINLWRPVMENGCIRFLRPEECPIHKPIREMKIKRFGEDMGNFMALSEYGEVT